MGKKIFLDTNIVADLIDANRVNHSPAIRMMEKLIEDDCGVCISEDILTTLFYISKSKAQTLEFFKNVILVDWEILSFGKETLHEGVDIALTEGVDLEDTLQCLCAKHNGCETIITNDSGFYGCGLNIVSSEQFLG
ncbi:MAG: type II toxin-antitoxin system VapC family toxin [Sulfuricurvum sp.]|jgi:predicted nucleic acid-binding protein|uniref:type II toxin-antitoxin system VapC family toxin n=1 Tax=Sulfuricurvum sp. TaxID=2025608 RepID=UPI0025E546C3|nr:type II toxin-antitoxin system VapC family toxin [Sulfuricurvum sp.]MCK9373089.1 type II toxin-antitoxin system VapC family toxin [Sulfuricurvum sp.]